MLEEYYGEILEIFDVEGDESEDKTHEHLIMTINDFTVRLNSLVKMANDSEHTIMGLEEEKALLSDKLEENQKFLCELEAENCAYKCKADKLQEASKSKEELEMLVEELNDDIMRTQLSLLSMGYGLELLS